MISTCLSIVQDKSSESFIAAIISFSCQSIVLASFLPDGKAVDTTQQYRDIWTFLASELSEPDTTQVIIAVPTVLWVVRVEGIPVWTLEKSSIYIRILLYLKQRGYCTFVQRFLYAITPDGQREGEEIVLLTPSSPKPEDFEKAADILRPREKDYASTDQSVYLITEPLHEGFEDPPPQKLLMVYPSVAKSYAEFLFEACPSLQWAAVAIGLAAKNENLYYYLAAENALFSSGDILTFFRQNKRGGHVVFWDTSESKSRTIVICGLETCTMEVGTFTHFDNLEKIPLKYAVALQRYSQRAGTNQTNAKKFALLTVCKMWGIRLYCERMWCKYLFRSSQKGHSEDNDWYANHLVYDPQQSVSPWILRSLQHLL